MTVKPLQLRFFSPKLSQRFVAFGFSRYWLLPLACVKFLREWVWRLTETFVSPVQAQS
ncbi:MAG: hypothetical protein N3B10_13805 [Armatimonadetes bacterium]|nr:hypothetical protein [Armatimonadota bacterium]MCX7969544.1 hypothetical protein [Armatimonadota bacterium]